MSPVAFARLCLAVLAALLALCLLGCLPATWRDAPAPTHREYRQHHRRAQQARRHRVRQRQLPRPNPEWRQRP